MDSAPPLPRPATSEAAATSTATLPAPRYWYDCGWWLNAAWVPPPPLATGSRLRAPTVPGMYVCGCGCGCAGPPAPPWPGRRAHGSWEAAAARGCWLCGCGAAAPAPLSEPLDRTLPTRGRWWARELPSSSSSGCELDDRLRFDGVSCSPGAWGWVGVGKTHQRQRQQGGR